MGPVTINICLPSFLASGLSCEVSTARFPVYTLQLLLVLMRQHREAAGYQLLLAHAVAKASLVAVPRFARCCATNANWTEWLT